MIKKGFKMFAIFTSILINTTYLTAMDWEATAEKGDATLNPPSSTSARTRQYVPKMRPESKEDDKNNVPLSGLVPPKVPAIKPNSDSLGAGEWIDVEK